MMRRHLLVAATTLRCVPDVWAARRAASTVANPPLSRKTPPTFNALAHAQFTEVMTPHLADVPDTKRSAVIMGRFLKLCQGEVTLFERRAIAAGANPTAPATPAQDRARLLAVTLSAKVTTVRAEVRKAALVAKIASQKWKQLEKEREKKPKDKSLARGELYHRAKAAAKAKALAAKIKEEARLQRRLDKAVAGAASLEREASATPGETDVAKVDGIADHPAVAFETVAHADIALELCFDALKAICGTEDVLDPALSFPKAVQLLRDLKQERFEPFIAVLATAAAQVGGGSGATLTRSYVAILPFCITMELFVLNYDPKEPLTHPATVLASLCAAHIPVPLLDNPTTADVADHFDVPLQGCESFFTELTDVCVSVLEEPPTTLRASRALVLQNARGCGKTYKALAIVSGLARLLATADGDRYAALRGRRVVPLYVGFGTTAALTDHERKYITAGGEGALECVLYARIAAAATAVSMDPSLVALPENGGALRKTLSVPKHSVKNLELLHCHHLKNKAITALCTLALTEALRGAEGEPPLVVLVVDDAVSVAAVVGGRTALRVCRELQVEVKLRGVPVVGLILDADPQVAPSGEDPHSVCLSGEAELPTKEEFAAIVAARLPDVSASDRAIISTVLYPRADRLPTRTDQLEDAFRVLDIDRR